ncbi:MAG: SDR family NAD(P)-dependent oxidoreductase [Planctomycetota bacterium]|jgi:NAD(P)-dependent dehydrogenase (short-subunit alcohol dehydrogenase family)
MELNGTTSVITGASGHLGRAVAVALAAAGCNCICHYNRNKQAAVELVEQIRDSGRDASAVSADLAQPDGAKKLFESIAENPAPQVLVNSAAVFSRQPLADIDFESARRILDLNLTASILTSRLFAEAVNSRFGSSGTPVAKIINFADIGGIRPWANYVLYCSSKAGLIGATKALAKELAPAICVNAVAPGVVTWPDGFDESQKQQQLLMIPMRRVARAEEITQAVIFLLKNDYITGQVLNVDGGRCI